MTFTWKHLRPMDRYRVRIECELSIFQVKTLAQLYQPLIGSLAHSLYMTLFSETEGEKHYSDPRNHQWLMNAVSVPLDQIYRARMRLEAIGLLKTFRLQDDEEKIFEYHLLPPLTPSAFFADDILSICLYNQTGATRFKQLRARYSSYLTDFQSAVDVEKEEVTQEFHEVFTSIHPSEFKAMEGIERQRELHALSEEYPLPGQTKAGEPPSFERYEVDLEMLQNFFMKGLDAQEILKPVHVQEIKKVAFFYQMDEYQLSRVIQDSLTLNDQLDLEKMKEKAKEWYRFQHGGQPPSVVHQVQPPHKRVMTGENMTTEEDHHLYRLETFSPLQLLEAYQGGGKVAQADLKLLEELLFEYELEPAVVNVLIEYIFLTNDFKLPKNLVTKVATHWKRRKVDNVRQAQDLAKKEHRQYKEWKAKQEKGQGDKGGRGNRSQGRSVSSVGRRGVRQDRLPKWVEDEEVQGESVQDGSALSVRQKKERMRSLLQALGETSDN